MKFRCSRCGCKIPYQNGKCSECKEISFQESIDKQVKRRQEKLRNTPEFGISRAKGVADRRFWASTHRNCFKASFGKEKSDTQQGGESDAHRDKKYERWCYHRKLGREVFTELILRKNMGRPDLVVIDKGFVFIEEIVESEREESITEKRKKYPFPIHVVRTDV